MQDPNGPPSHHGAGVDHAPPPPPPDFAQIMNPDFWNRWSQGRGWDDHADAWAHGPHAHGRRRGGGGFGRRSGFFRHGRHGGEDNNNNNEEAERTAAGSDDDDNEAFPPEYISDDEVAAATAAAEAEKKGANRGEKDASPDTMMQDDNAQDPPEEVPNADEPAHHRGGRRHGGRRGGGGGGGPFAGFGGREGGFHHGGRRGGPRGPHGHHHGGPPPPPFGGPFGAMFGGGGGHPRRHSRGPHGHHHHGPPGGAPPMFEAFFGPPRGPHHGPPHGFGGGPRGPRHHHRGPSGTGAGAGGAFDLSALMAALANHPAAQQVREYIERLQGQGRNGDDDNAMTPNSSDDGMEDAVASFSPPLDLFEQADRWVLHLAVPGAKKEDVGVNWDAQRSVLSVGGVVHRAGDEEFLRGLVSGERSVGLFSREVRLPFAGRGAKEEVDAEGIEAKMEEGVLVINVPKVEKDWTEVKRVEIQ